MSAQSWLTHLHTNGCRLTGARRAVISTIATSTRPLSPAEVYEAARAEYPGLGLVTVYRTIEKLEKLGLIQRVHKPQGCQAFIAAGDGHQHVLLCQICGSTLLFNCNEMEQLYQDIAEQTGYIVRDHWLQLFGICSQCLKGQHV